VPQPTAPPVLDAGNMCVYIYIYMNIVTQ
jgi:hypothetical protein